MAIGVLSVLGNLISKRTPIGVSVSTIPAGRINGYIRYKRLYDGWAIRQNTNGDLQFKILKYNLSRPICDISATFMAGRPISFWVPGNDAATQRMKEIWKYSKGDSSFFQAALQTTIIGDGCIVAGKDKDDEVAKLMWIDPFTAFPVFDSHDCDKLEAMVFEYPITKNGEDIAYREVWMDGTVFVFEGETQVEEWSYDEKAFGGLPIEWVKNQSVMGDHYGTSDIAGAALLFEEYDHLAGKNTKVLDYYGGPNLYTKGIGKRRDIIEKGERTVFHLPENGEIGFIEWKGTPQGFDAHLDRILENISDQTETPRVAISKMDAGIRDVSGVAIKMMFAPLIAKTNRKRLSWCIPLIRAMRKALLIENINIREDDIAILWPSPLPTNDLEDWQISSLKSTLGVSNSQILREHGYSEAQIEEIQKEKDEEEETKVERLATQFDAGGPPTPPGKGDKGGRNQSDSEDVD